MHRSTLVSPICLMIIVSGLGAQPKISNQPDILTGTIDPVNLPQQRDRFLKAATVDNELSADEFKTNQALKNGFVRKFDQWRKMIIFDKNNNRKISWLEAQAYRADLRKRLFKAFDADKNDKLGGDERKKAIAMLSSGKIPGDIPFAKPKPIDPAHRKKWITRHDADKDGKMNRREFSEALKARIKKQQARALAKYDTDKNGTLSDEERSAAAEAIAVENANQEIDSYDTDGDGELSEEERKVMKDEFRARRKQRKKEMLLRYFDDDGDGEVGEKETAELKKFMGQWKGVMEKLKNHAMDLDGDGEISATEQTAAMAEWMTAGQKMMIKSQTWMDRDGDGEVSIQEKMLFGRHVERRMDQWMDDFALAHADEQGRFGPAQRQAAFTALRDEIYDRIDSADSDKDGRVSASEAMSMLEGWGMEIGIIPDPDGPPPWLDDEE